MHVITPPARVCAALASARVLNPSPLSCFLCAHSALRPRQRTAQPRTPVRPLPTPPSRAPSVYRVLAQPLRASRPMPSLVCVLVHVSTRPPHRLPETPPVSARGYLTTDCSQSFLSRLYRVSSMRPIRRRSSLLLPACHDPPDTVPQVSFDPSF